MKYLSYSLTVIVFLLCAGRTVCAQDLAPYSVRMVIKAHELQQKEQYKEAISVLTEIDSKREYDRAYVNRMLGRLYWQIENYKKAIHHLGLCLDAKQLVAQEQLETGRMLADILLSEGHYAQAESRYKELTSLYSSAQDLQNLWFRIAQSQYQQHKWSSVEQSITRLQKYQQQANSVVEVAPLNMLLGAQLSQKKWQSSLKTVLKLRELEPEEKIWWQQIIALYMQTNNHKRALVTLQQADRAELELSEPQLKLMAQLYMRLGVPNKAAKTYQRLSKLKGSAQLLAQQATYWQYAKEWQNALQSWKKAAQIKPQYYREYALLALQLKDYPNALSALQKVPKQDATILLIKTQILNEQGDSKAALLAATQAHKISPSEQSLSWVKYLTQINKA